MVILAQFQQGKKRTVFPENNSVVILAQFQLLLCLFVKLNHEELYTEYISLMPKVYLSIIIMKMCYIS